MKTIYLKKIFSLLIGTLIVCPICSTGQTLTFALQEGYVPNPFLIHLQSQWRWNKETVYDTSLVRIQYRMSFWNPEKSEKYHDIRIVSIGKNGFKKDGSERLDFFDTKNVGSLHDSLQHFSFSSPVYPADFYIDPQGKSWTLFRTMMLGPILRYEEKAAQFHWQLSLQTDTIAGYFCQKAKTHYQGRQYEAWYCPGISIDAGPYKFCGLPGLIVKIEDTANDYSWELTGIEKSHRPITEKQFVVQKTSRNQARKLITDMFDKPYHFLSRLTGARGRIVMLDEFDRERPPSGKEFSISLYYRPIELE